MLQHVARDAEVSLDGGWVRLATHSVAMTQADEALWQKIVPLIGGAARFHPPRVRDITREFALAEDDIRRVMQLAGRKGLAHEIARDHFLTRAAMMEIASAISELAAIADGGGFSVAQLRDRLATSRKIALHILEFFDRHGVTGRRGDLRLLNAARLDLFRTSAD